MPEIDSFRNPSFRPVVAFRLVKYGLAELPLIEVKKPPARMCFR